MKLTKRLWGFWEGLNKGEIDWKFINNEDISEQERDVAKHILIERGFVKVLDDGKKPSNNLSHWVVKDYHGNIFNPCFEGKRGYFTAEKYAQRYASYLRSQSPRKGYRVEDFAEHFIMI